MRLEVLACDLDGTLADTYEPLSQEMINRLESFMESGTHLAILTDEIEENIETRVTKFFKDRSRLHIFSDGGTVGFGFKNGSIDEYFRYNFHQSQERKIEEVMARIFGPFSREPNPSKHRYGVQISREPTAEEISEIERSLQEIGITESLSYLGNGILRFNPFGKHRALKAFLERTNTPQKEVIIIADQTAKYRSDWRMFRDFDKATRVHVGPRIYAMDDSRIIFPGEENQRTTLSFLDELKRDIIVDTSFQGNRRLYHIWVKDIGSRTGRSLEHVEQFTRTKRPRHPILPEEQAIYLLPYVKRLATESQTLPVLMARGMLPAANVLEAIASSIPEINIMQPLVMKTASFEDVQEYNPHASGRKNYFEHDLTLAISINSLLGEEAHTALTAKMQRVRKENSLVSNSLGGLIQEISSGCVSPDYRQYLKRFYTARFYQTSFLFMGKTFDADAYVEHLAGIDSQERKAIREELAIYDGGKIDDWEKVWTINQSAIRQFNSINNVAYHPGSKHAVLKELLAETSLAREYSDLSWIGLDDSQLTGRSHIIFRLIADAISSREHSFGVFSSTTSYGQHHSVDFVLTDGLLFPEKDFELYDGTFSLQQERGVWAFKYQKYDVTYSPKTKGKRPELQEARHSLDADYLTLNKYFRRDTRLDPFEFILYNHLTNGPDQLISSIVEEYLPNRNENPHFIDLGSRIIEFSRKALPDFQKGIEKYRASQENDPFENNDMESFRDYLYSQFMSEIRTKKQDHNRRMIAGVEVLSSNHGTVIDYISGVISFDSLRHELVPKIYAV